MLLGGARRRHAGWTLAPGDFSRYLRYDKRHQFPAPLDAHAVGSLDYSRCSRRTARTWCSSTWTRRLSARRVFEITGCGTAVASTSLEATRAPLPGPLLRGGGAGSTRRT
ncbi:hypothetical protein QJS66_03300 [Kocuria rhizophila]|nr:hypothetical protein QJS66_03300 [Kocuria rhizophila]